MKKILILLLLLSGCGLKDKVSLIKQEKAQSIALKDVGVNESDVSIANVELKNDNEVAYYEISFHDYKNVHIYNIDAYTGKIIKTKKQKLNSSYIGNYIISEDEAKEIALKHAKVNDVTYTKVELSYDNGMYQYEIEFYTKDFKEFDYDILADFGGDVIAYDYDAESYSNQVGNEIDIEKAKEIALSQIPGATLKDVYHIEIDNDEGKIEYNGKIIFNNLEYEFSIDGYTGVIRSWEVESID